MSIELIEIPIQKSIPSLKQRMILDDVEVVMRFDWNSRNETWHISFYDSVENPLLVGIPLFVNYDIIGRFIIDGMPPGQILCYDTSGQNMEAGLDDLGDRCKVYYVSGS